MAKDLTDALQALTEEASGQTSRADRALPAAKPTTTIPPRSGSSGPIPGAVSGGIASPLTETAYSARTYWADKTITSTDGLITIAIAPIKQMTFTDANEQVVQFDFKQPT